MRFVVADAGPLHYLVLTGDIALLPSLFAKVLTPERVHDELAHAQAPEAVRAWIAMAPPWLEICPVEGGGDADDLAALDAGERDAIALALATKADLVLMDDQGGVAALDLLDLAARKGLVDLAADGDHGVSQKRRDARKGRGYGEPRFDANDAALRPARRRD